jgi:hypothetical protein
MLAIIIPNLVTIIPLDTILPTKEGPEDGGQL